MPAKAKEKTVPSVDKKYIITIDGKEFVKYAGILSEAHVQNLTSIIIDLVQIPEKSNDYTAICKCSAKFADGREFVDYGDASPQNCDEIIAKHLVRMASTRASARALRNAVNIGTCSFEELADYSDVTNGNNGKTSSKPPADSKQQKKETNDSHPAISISQLTAIQKLAEKRGIDAKELDKISRKKYKNPVDKLTGSQASTFIRDLQSQSAA